MSEPSAPPVSGLVAGKYEVLRILGRGGMGSVWEGRHATLGTRVAIKFIDSEYVENEEAQTRFANEAKAAAAIQSKHAIHIYDHGVTGDGRPYIVMELLTGEPLDKRLDALGRVPLPDTARIIGQVCKALQRAHDAGIIHRDLKPENIFLVRTPDDDEDMAKVLDFGIAKIKGNLGDKAISSSTRTGTVMGTPFYMSPEQARGLRNVDYRSDLWSLGVIAYRCVTGQMAFDGESVGDLLVKVCTAPLPVPTRVVPDLPRGFDAWFARALEREPSARFQSALELADALALAAGLSVRRGPASSQQQLGQTPSAPLAQAMPVAPTLDSITSAGSPPNPAQMTSPPFVTSQAPPTPPRTAALLAIGAAGLVAGSIGVAAVVKTLGPKPAPSAAAASVVPSAAVPVQAAPVAPQATSATSLALPAAVAVTASAAPAKPGPTTWTGHGFKPPSTKPQASVASPPPPPVTPAAVSTAAAPPPPPPPPKKPATDDPGY
jgi:serine/threonine-protein kinase